jgi:hypothetical protein
LGRRALSPVTAHAILAEYAAAPPGRPRWKGPPVLFPVVIQGINESDAWT